MMSLKLLLELLLLLKMLFMRPPLTNTLLFVTSSPGDLHEGDFWSKLRMGEELGLEVAEEVCWGGVGREGEGSSMVPSGSAIDEAVDFLPGNRKLKKKKTNEY